jgi:hypothetical protein
MYIVSGFYNEYGRISLNIQPDMSESDNCGDHLTNQTKFMSIERVFTLLDTLTKNLPDREIIAQRLVGHLAGRSKISYETLEEAAASVFANGFVKK